MNVICIPADTIRSLRASHSAKCFTDDWNSVFGDQKWFIVYFTVIQLRFPVHPQSTSAMFPHSFQCLSQAEELLWCCPSQFSGSSWCPSPQCPSSPKLWALCWLSAPLPPPGSGHEAAGRGKQGRWCSGPRCWCGSCAEPWVWWRRSEKPCWAAGWAAAGRTSAGRAATRCPGSAACVLVGCSPSCGWERLLHKGSIVTRWVLIPLWHHYNQSKEQRNQASHRSFPHVWLPEVHQSSAAGCSVRRSRPSTPAALPGRPHTPARLAYWGCLSTWTWAREHKGMFHKRHFNQQLRCQV